MKKYLILSFLCVTLFAGAQPALRLPAIISNHAVLQQNSDVKLWGWAPCTWPVKISCSWNPTDTVSVMPEKDCSWSVSVKTPKASDTAHSITFISRDQKITINDILVGEVWLCSGQSNMEYSFNWGTIGAGDDVEQSANKEIRFFRIPHSYNNYPQTNSDGEWKICTPETVKDMSVIGYYLGKRINETTQSPVGLIASYWGGTCVQAWMPQEVFTKDEELNKMANDLPPVNWAPVAPSVIYNAMIYPLLPYRIAGTIWYQGEANTDQPQDYGRLFMSMIKSWRGAFNNDFPFYFVQIAPWNGYGGISAAILQEQQASALALPKTGMISVGDLVDDITDIHPKLKPAAGNRLADLVLREQYGADNLQPYHPRISVVSIDKDKAKLTVISAGKLTCNDKEIKNFQIAGADRIFYPATAVLQKDGTIMLTAKQVKSPASVRYCFTNDAMPNLFDTNGLPLLPFRSDKW
ncbi:MAG: sialate O-acetylesterase [Dysgonamonadaceae bacterium]|jgi:sialate O-acetylesterase|nr:sialate O-acetylesterase [Dysgonamonadaceae bacterium]